MSEAYPLKLIHQKLNHILCVEELGRITERDSRVTKFRLPLGLTEPEALNVDSKLLIHLFTALSFFFSSHFILMGFFFFFALFSLILRCHIHFWRESILFVSSGHYLQESVSFQHSHHGLHKTMC